MKDIMQKLAELEATAPKVTKKKMLKEDSTTPPINVSNKTASLKDMFAALSENVVSGQKPLPVLDPQNKQAGMGFVTSNNPAVQNMLKNLDPKDVQIVQAPGQAPATGQPQATAAGQPNPNQMQAGQQAMQEVDMGQAEKGMRKSTPHTGGYKVVDSSGKVISTHKGQRDAMQAALKNDDYSVKAIKEGAGANDWHNDMEQWALSKGQKNKGAKPALQRAADRDKDWALSHRKSDTVKEGAKVDRMVKHIEKSERGLGKSKEKASDIAWATANKRGMLDNKNKKKVKEGDIPSSRGVDTMGAGLGAGRSATTLEGKKGVNPFAKKDEKASTKAPAKGKKPDFLDLDKDGNKKEPMKKAAADKNKKKVKESMNHRISAARLEGKSHGLRGHAHSGKRYEDLDEVRAYHEGYKEGLDECYGQGVYETAPAMPAATVGGMADAAMGEGNAFTAALAKTPKGGKFSVGGKTFTDRTGYDAKVNEYAFESWDNQLNDLLNEGAEVNEGLSVSISKGQENSPDSVTITAQDAEAEHLLAFVKNAGLGLFGDDNADTHSSAMSVQPSHGAPDEVGAGGIDIGVVDGHDGMMGLMQKLSGIQSGGAEDYADEEGEEQLYGNHEEAGKKDCGCDGDCECSDYDQPSNEETCNECGGMMEAGHSCGSKEMVDEVEDDEWYDKDGNVDPHGAHDAGGAYYRERDQVDEVESEDQMEFEVAEDNAPDSDEAETSADEDAEAKEDAALAGAASGDEEEMNESDDEEDEEVAESFSFESFYKKLAMLESTESEDEKAEKAGKKVAKDIEHDEGHKGKDDDKAEKAGKKVTKDIEYDDKKDKREKVDEWANQVGDGPGKGTDASFEQDIDFMTKVISGGLNKQKSTGQTTIPVIAGQTDRMGVTKEAVNESVSDWVKLAGIK